MITSAHQKSEEWSLFVTIILLNKICKYPELLITYKNIPSFWHYILIANYICDEEIQVTLNLKHPSIMHYEHTYNAL